MHFTRSAPLSDVERAAILVSSDFHSFFDRASLLVERVLYANQRVDPFVSYIDDADQTQCAHPPLPFLPTHPLAVPLTLCC